jgi:hypothetical protein
VDYRWLGMRELPIPPEKLNKKKKEDNVNNDRVVVETLFHAFIIFLALLHLPLTPALASRQEAKTGSNGAGMGTTGRSLVLMPRCCRDMCECSELRDLATVPH